MIVKLRSSLKNPQGQGMTEYVLIITLVALVSIVAFIYFRHAIKSKIASETAQETVQVVKKVEEEPPCLKGEFPTVFIECYQDGIVLAKIESHISCLIPEVLVDLNGCMVFKVLPETIKRLDQAIVEVQMVTACPVPIESLLEIGERTLFALANYRRPIPISTKK